MMTVEQIEEALDITCTLLKAIKETLAVQGKNIKLNIEVAVMQQKRINNLEEQVRALIQNTHTHHIVEGYMQKPDNFDTTGVVE